MVKTTPNSGIILRNRINVRKSTCIELIAIMSDAFPNTVFHGNCLPGTGGVISPSGTVSDADETVAVMRTWKHRSVYGSAGIQSPCHNDNPTGKPLP